jgi:hypothetical protein
MSDLKSDRMMTTGKWSFVACILCLIAGRVVVRTFFPESQGTGISPVALAILIPIWSLGAVGLGLMVMSKVRRLFGGRFNSDTTMESQLASLSESDEQNTRKVA